jgi:predicted nucleic acid-binding protein
LAELTEGRVTEILPNLVPPEGWKIALTTYDASYLLLARQMQAELVTLDAKLLDVAKR